MYQSQTQQLFLKGVLSRHLKVNIDERGSLTELLRKDWKDIVKEPIRQIIVSKSKPGVVRAWHRHTRGQVDYMVVVKGTVDIWLKKGSQTYKIRVWGKHPKLVRIPGKYWHGYQNVGDEECIVLYFINKLYDYENPDEERMPYKEEM